MNFKAFLEQNQLSGPQDLPPIPPGMLRATNFTNPTVGPKLLNGEPFKYGRGMITSSTDAFSDNQSIWKLLTTGTAGAFDRNSFGNHVVLLDIPNDEYRMYANPALGISQVDNSRILGIFDRQNQTLQKNDNYNPQKPIKLPVSNNNPRRFGNHSQPGSEPTPVPVPSSSSAGNDIW